jgi:hypothetical protein
VSYECRAVEWRRTCRSGAHQRIKRMRTNAKFDMAKSEANGLFYARRSPAPVLMIHLQAQPLKPATLICTMLESVCAHLAFTTTAGTPPVTSSLVSIWLGADISDCLVDYHSISTVIPPRHSLVLDYQTNIPLWMASASLSGISMLNSSSIAMTTSTVSKLSRPRSFEKCAFPFIYHASQYSCSCYFFGSSSLPCQRL